MKRTILGATLLALGLTACTPRQEEIVPQNPPANAAYPRDISLDTLESMKTQLEAIPIKRIALGTLSTEWEKDTQAA